ncbi:MAG TPA: MerR family transcriptional regulator, partial [Amycolatopsis sp.]|nr:MerR family transcriptional regulator [Amycolatopsis sp.]
MDELTIGAFAARVGPAPSALRCYDDCDVLKPARVDDTTGYRHYRADQVERGLLLRDLRAAGLPLAEVVTVRGLRPDSATGSGRFLAPAPDLAGLARWAARRRRVRIEFERGGVEADDERYSL